MVFGIWKVDIPNPNPGHSDRVIIQKFQAVGGLSPGSVQNSK